MQLVEDALGVLRVQGIGLWWLGWRKFEGGAEFCPQPAMVIVAVRARVSGWRGQGGVVLGGTRGQEPRAPSETAMDIGLVKMPARGDLCRAGCRACWITVFGFCPKFYLFFEFYIVSWRCSCGSCLIEMMKKFSQKDKWMH